ncbi:UDP-galactopyranose mutase [Xenorhabdus bovienii]|uniref:UDP-galactopyranose mutase n=1 Tax=Xenorhabdus bovienii TaxID=40576 RepID=UPI0023B313C9|nr:UDP-galactopyranose mutase [Xenorhabdus bovienii]MDE9481666.1 UDP-galactopyranose mutase [Xenorhabdus bovienii]
MYDYLIIGSGFFGAVCAHKLKEKGKKILILEKRNHIGGNAFTENINGIHVHKYGAHIFHTNDKTIWDYVNSFVEFNRFTNSPLANYKGELYNLPFNMNTFYQLWKTKTPQEAIKKINEQKAELNGILPSNLEEKAISLVGRDIYEKLIKGYTEKQWGRSANELPSFIISRLPVRMNFDNNYFSDKYQGIPENGYTDLFNKMLSGIEIRLNTDFFQNRNYFTTLAKKIIYTGPIDQFYDYRFGPLEYRTLKFEHEELNIDNYQGNAVINYTEKEIPFTRIIEHKHFNFSTTNTTVISKEYPSEWKLGDEPYYPINNHLNMDLFDKYRKLSKLEKNIYFGGRLAEYKYYDMHQVIRAALNFVNKLD